MKRLLKITIAIVLLFSAYLTVDITVNHWIQNAILPFILYVMCIVAILYVE